MKLPQFRQPSVLPGFWPCFAYTLLYLSLIVLLPLAALIWKTGSMTFAEFWHVTTTPRALAAYRLTFGASVLAAVVNAIFGFIVAWVLVRYRFPGRRLVDALIDLPFALPTAVSGIALTQIYHPQGWLGQYFYAWGIRTAYSPLGIMIALVFIGIPFVVRTLQPAIEELPRENEEAAASLGATRWQAFRWVVFPNLLPALIAGFSMAFARALGEYGSVAFISGNMPKRTEITSLLIVGKLDQHELGAAAAIAAVMLLASFILLLAINLITQWSSRLSRST